MRKSLGQKTWALWKKISIGGIGILLALVSPVLADSPSIAQVKPLLEGYEWKVKPELFRALGEDADLALMAFLENSQDDPSFYRMRALEALRLFPKERVAEFLERFLAQAGQPAEYLGRGLNSFRIAFAASQPGRVQLVAERLLKHQDPHIRLSAAQALRKLEAPAAHNAVQRHLATEKEAWVREVLQAR